MARDISRDEFCTRFSARLVSTVGETFGDGTSIREYANDAAPGYFDDDDLEDQSPEECADIDVSYWEE